MFKAIIGFYWLNRKNIREVFAELVTVHWPFTGAGMAATGFHTIGGTRLVINCKVKGVEFVGQLTMALLPESAMDNNSGEDNGMLKTVP